MKCVANFLIGIIMSVSMLVSCAEKEQEQEFWLGADLGRN
jgi:hypothetical protein